MDRARNRRPNAKHGRSHPWNTCSEAPDSRVTCKCSRHSVRVCDVGGLPIASQTKSIKE
ncbi:hypothetical protein HMPREF0972_02115 [Actinomyces sp. oral taxon 848 str. F0332]|nr:hypothetical protein HMPREF0972_02115 [Actinomyces sp. oral taxon 848 str. F0332]